jgi:hypothetical protein
LKDRTSVDAADRARREEVTAASPLQSECHELTLCADDAALVSGFSRSIEVALDNGNANLVIATESHRAHLLQKLRADAVEVDAAVEPGLLIVLDAADSLSKFTVATATDENRSAGMPYIIVEAVRRAEERHLHVAVG